MKIGKKISGVLIAAFAAALVFASIGFVGKRDVGYRIEDIKVTVENRLNNFFVDEADVLDLIMREERDSVLGDQFGRVDLRALERQIESHSFVKEAEVFRDLKGHLVVKAHQSKPVARLISPRGVHAYISEEGRVLPTSTKYTARVVVLTGDYLNALVEKETVMDDEYDQQLFELVEFVNEHRFWKKQIGEIHVNKKGKVIMYPQVGRQRLEFGRAENIEKKFSKLMIFFKEIMPTKGWNAYSKVNVEFKDQIICE